MLEFDLRGVRCRVSPLFPGLLAVMTAASPDAATAVCVLAAAMHECGHLLAMAACGCPPDSLTMGAFGMRIRDSCFYARKRSVQKIPARWYG